MSDFIRYVLYELNSILIVLALGGLLAAAVIAVSFLLFKKKYKNEKRFPFGMIILYLMFAGYLFVVISATILRKTGGSCREYNFHLFRAWLESWNNFSIKNWANVLLNIAMFVPLGVLLPLIWKKCRKWYVSIPIGFGFSFLIELVQLIICRGICDVDDLFANTLGAVVGFFLIMAVLSLFNEKGYKLIPFMVYGGMALVPIMAIVSIFVAYDLKEYGNLVNAPAYINNTKGVSWQLDCEFPWVQNTVPTYRTQTRNMDQCDAFAAEIAEKSGLSVDLTSYYQEYAYYNLRPGGVLFVYYHDGSYEFMSAAHWGDGNWIETDRETIEKALDIYSAEIPNQAAFCYEGDGWHSFTASHDSDGFVMYDGILRVRYADSGKIEEIKNHLCAYTYYEEIDIISPEEAFNRLKAGKFNDDGYFEHIKPSAMSVTKCVLDYQVDTKGFYQPVYLFSMKAVGDSYTYTVMIPAMK